MFDFGARSRTNLDTCHEDLQALALAVMALQCVDFSIGEGHRTLATHLELIAKRPAVTKVAYTDSMHSHDPSWAVHFLPYPVNWNDAGAFYMLIGMVRAVASQMGIEIRVGADWDMDGKTDDQKFHDLCHVELVQSLAV